MYNLRRVLIIFSCIALLYSGKFLKPLWNQKFNDELSICALFKNEAPYLKEWIEFHKLQGVGHFFLYNNNSSDDYLAVLEPYILSHDVTLIDWPYTYESVTEGDALPWLSIQRNAYTDCLKKHGTSTKWLAAIDLDEFLFCPSGQSLPQFLERYKAYGGLCVNWLMFGTSNLDSLSPNDLLIENLVQCAPENEPRNYLIKSIVQTKYAKRAKSAHEFQYRKGYFAVNVFGDRIRSLRSPRISHNLIRINHYWTRTENYFAKNKIASRNGRRTYEDEQYLRGVAQNYNQCMDTAILQFVPLLKQEMFLKNKQGDIE